MATLPSRRCDLEGGRFIRNDLESLSGRPARVVDVRFFGELSVDETAAGMEGSERSVRREGRKARAFLFAALRREGLG